MHLSDPRRPPHGPGQRLQGDGHVRDGHGELDVRDVGDRHELPEHVHPLVAEVVALVGGIQRKRVDLGDLYKEGERGQTLEGSFSAVSILSMLMMLEDS